MRTRKMWTEADLRILLEEYSGSCTNALAVKLARKKGDLHNKAMRMGLKKSADLWDIIKAHREADPTKNPKSTGTIWTRKQAGIISANNNATRAELAELLDTTPKNLSRVISQFRGRGWLPPFEKKVKVLKVPKLRPIKTLMPKKEKIKKVLIKTIKASKVKAVKAEKPKKFKPLEVLQGRTITSAMRITKACKMPVPKPPVKVFNRDIGKVAVQIDRRTWKYMLLEAAEQFKQAQL